MNQVTQTYQPISEALVAVLAGLLEGQLYKARSWEWDEAVRQVRAHSQWLPQPFATAYPPSSLPYRTWDSAPADEGGNERLSDQWGPDDGLGWGLCCHGEKPVCEEGKRKGDLKTEQTKCTGFFRLCRGRAGRKDQGGNVG